MEFIRFQVYDVELTKLWLITISHFLLSPRLFPAFPPLQDISLYSVRLLQTFSTNTYRNFIRYLKENIYYHTYQLKEERAYRIVIKHLHHSTDIEEIRQELLELEHKARNILNTQHRITKEPLNLFFIDLEPAENNKEVYKITAQLPYRTK